MKICIVGTGYVGLVSGVCYSEVGHEVTCVDKDMKKVEQLKMKPFSYLRTWYRRITFIKSTKWTLALYKQSR